MSQIKDAIATIKDLKISISKVAIIYALNNFDSYFRPYLAILSHDVQEKKKLSTLGKLIKTLKDK